MRDPFGIPGAAVRAVAAGNDLLCLGRDVPEEGYLAVRAALVHAVGAGELPESRLAATASEPVLLEMFTIRGWADRRNAGTNVPVTATTPNTLVS